MCCAIDGIVTYTTLITNIYSRIECVISQSYPDFVDTVRAYICMRVRMVVRTHIRTYVCMYVHRVCMHVCIVIT